MKQSVKNLINEMAINYCDENNLIIDEINETASDNNIFEIYLKNVNYYLLYNGNFINNNLININIAIISDGDEIKNITYK